MAEPYPAENWTILIVDDDDDARNITEQMLQAGGYHTRAFRRGRDALERLQAQPERFDLAILDVVMPDMSGPKLLAQMREVRPDLPILLYTGMADTQQMRKEPNTQFLAKPFSLDTLLHTVSELLRDSATR